VVTRWWMPASLSLLRMIDSLAITATSLQKWWMFRKTSAVILQYF
jgi:hypothetical protein